MPVKRSRFAAAATVSLAIALTGCSSTGGGDTNATSPSEASACQPSNGKVTLSFATWIPGIADVVKLWNAKNPNIQVKVESVPGGANGTYQNFSNAIQAKNTPDLGQIEYYALPSFRVQGGLRDIAGCSGVSAAKADFSGALWEQVALGESKSVYAIPHDTGPMGLYYRKDLFKKAGIPVPTTWEQYADAAAKIAALGDSITNFSVSSGEIPPIAGYVAQAGGQWFGTSDGKWTVDLTGPESTKVMAYWQDLLSKKYVSTIPGFTDSWNQAYNKGKVWTWISGPWGANGIMGGAPDTAGDWAVAPLPQWSAGANVTGAWGGSSTAVFEYSKHPAEAAKFAQWLNTSPEALSALVKLGSFPADSTAGDKVPALSEGVPFFGNQAIYQTFLDAGQKSAPFTWGPTMTQTFGDVSDGFAGAIAGNGTLLQGLQTGQQKTVQALKAAGIPVSE
ncbi:ABC transporter substrate-binding protein [Nonomuraea sp. NPDC002799]